MGPEGRYENFKVLLRKFYISLFFLSIYYLVLPIQINSLNDRIRVLHAATFLFFKTFISVARKGRFLTKAYLKKFNIR
jgi:hypothetical protein